MEVAPPQCPPERALEEFWADCLATIPDRHTHLRLALLSATVGARRQRMDLEHALEELAPSFGSLAADDLKRRLGSYPTTERFLGRFFWAALVDGRVNEQQQPRDWQVTETNLRDVAADVDRFAVHWDQNYATSAATLTALLAEVEALRYDSRPGGSAPEARVLRAGSPWLVEIKSLWGYGRLKRNDLMALPAGVSPVYTFLVDKAPRSREERDQPHVRIGRHNKFVLGQVVRHLLGDAAKQLDTYASLRGLADQQLIVLVTTSRQPVVGIVDAGIRLAQTWLRRHSRVDDVIYLSAGEACSVRAHHVHPPTVRLGLISGRDILTD